MAHSPPTRTPATALHYRHLSLDRMRSIRVWHVKHKDSHPVEYHLLDAVLTMWMMGWIGLLPAFALGQSWAYPLCLFGICTPMLYLRLRGRAHRRGQLRCAWLGEAGVEQRAG